VDAPPLVLCEPAEHHRDSPPAPVRNSQYVELAEDVVDVPFDRLGLRKRRVQMPWFERGLQRLSEALSLRVTCALAGVLAGRSAPREGA
jgi:hypothetical protein